MKKVLPLAILLLIVAPALYSDCSTLDITDEYIPPFTHGVAGSFTFTPWGGTPPYTYSIYSGTLPAGLSLSSGGTISGTPTSADFQLVCFTITDSVGCHITKCLYITVN